jgi:hypothetical protein
MKEKSSEPQCERWDMHKPGFRLNNRQVLIVIDPKRRVPLPRLA